MHEVTRATGWLVHYKQTLAIYSPFDSCIRNPTMANTSSSSSSLTFTISATAGLSPTTANITIFTSFLSVMAFAVLRTKKRSLPPGPTAWHLVSCLFQVLRSKPYFRWILRAAAGKDITFFNFSGTKVVVVNCPKIAKEFLLWHDLAFASRPLSMTSGYYSRGFLSVAICPMGEQWRKMRRVVSADLISPGQVNATASILADEADHLLRFIRNQCRSPGEGAAVIDVRLAVRYYCGCLIRRMIFGRRLWGDGGSYGGPGKEEIDHVEAAFAVDKLLFAFCVSDLVPWLRRLDLDGHRKTVEAAMAVINKYHDPIVDERIRRRRGGIDTEGGSGDAEDLLDIMIELKDDDGKPLLTADEMKAQAAELFFAAIDNPSNVVEWAIAELINKPELLRRAAAELDAAVGKDRLVQESDFPKLPFIKSVARESLRLHPVSAFNMPHTSTEDAVVAGYLIPKNTNVLLSRVGLGRNPEVWPDPLRFDPGRHTKCVELAEPDLRFISFSGGRRRCMGALLGTPMAYLMLARLVQAFEWSPAPGSGGGGVDLEEGETSFFMKEPLRVLAKPRLEILEKL